ncbi:MAG: histidinol-phosphate transaminase [Bacteroidales bacterium]|nr:histidinol-phosphate transaminase [Bacteroidales bacterium]
MNLDKFIRKNILDMEAYSAARDLVAKGDYIFLDANENPFGTWNRYPDPLQKDPKALLAKLKGFDPESMVMGNGSDEILDLLYRACCNPERDNVISLAPSYGMYYTLACLNNVEFKEVMLDDDFDFQPQDILSQVNPNTKMVIICSPNNPTGKSFDIKKILEIAKNFDGFVVVDEAYNDFSPMESCIPYIKDYDNIMVIQTFSKAWGLASLRAGVGYMSKEMAEILNKIKMPYNMDGFTQKAILERLSDLEGFQKTVELLIAERNRLMDNLGTLSFIEKIYPSDSNFFMIKTARHKELQEYMLKNGVILRSRHSMPKCQNCIRITIGTPEQNDLVFQLMKKFA